MNRPAGLALTILCLSGHALAGPPDGYYDTVDAANSTTLRTTLHAVIDDHTEYPYSSSNTDTWDILELADEDPNNSGNILDVYRNRSIQKFGGGNGPYNREHTWPKSYGFPVNTPGQITRDRCNQYGHYSNRYYSC